MAKKPTKTNKAPALVSSNETVQESNKPAPALVSSNETVQESNKPAPALSAVAGGEPPQSGDTPLCRKVKAHMDSLRNATTTELHALAVECVEHAAGPSGDMRPLLTFQQSMPPSLRKASFVAWCKAIGPCKWGKIDPKTGDADGLKKDHAADANPWNLELARSTPFYAVPEKQVAPVQFMDVLKKIQADVKKIDECLADPAIPRKNGETDDMLKALKAKHGKVIAALMAA